MARKATVDVDKVLQMLREGQSTQAVAEHFRVSRQAIDLHRRRFIQSGRLRDRRAPRQAPPPQPAGSGILSARQAGHSAYIARKAPAVGPGEPPAVKVPPEVSLDRLIELVIEAFDSLRKVPKLEAELEKYRRDYQNAAERIELLQKELGKRKEQEVRWQQVTHSEGGNPVS